MSTSNKNGPVLSELQQLRSIVLGEYTVEIDQRLADLEELMRKAQIDLAQAIDDANNLGANEIQAVRDLVDEKSSDINLNVNQQLKAINERLASLEANSVNKQQLGDMMISLGQQLKSEG